MQLTCGQKLQQPIITVEIVIEQLTLSLENSHVKILSSAITEKVFVLVSNFKMH